MACLIICLRHQNLQPIKNIAILEAKGRTDIELFIKKMILRIVASLLIAHIASCKVCISGHLVLST